MKRLLLLLLLASPVGAVVTYNGAAVFTSSVTVSTFSALSLGPSKSDFSVISSSPTFGFYVDPATLRLNSHTSANILIMSLDAESQPLGFKRQGTGTSSLLNIGQFSQTGGINVIGAFYINDGSTPYFYSKSVLLNDTTPPTIGGTLQLYGYTSAQLGTSTPSSSGQVFRCSDCSTVPVCISTATTRGAFSLITNKTAACQ